MKVVQQGLNIHVDCVGGRESGKRDETAETVLTALWVGRHYILPTKSTSIERD